MFGITLDIYLSYLSFFLGKKFDVIGNSAKLQASAE